MRNESFGWERHAKLGIKRRLRLGKAQEKAETAIGMLRPFKCFRHSNTTDNAPEFTRHDVIAKKLGVAVCFSNPYHSFGKKSEEKYNKAICQSLTKKADLDISSDPKAHAS